MPHSPSRYPGARVRPTARRARVATRPAVEWTLFVRWLAAALLGALATVALTRRLGAQAQQLDGARLTAPTPSVPAPSPALSPDDVVAAVLDALARNDTPTKDRGIEITFTFSSPANRAAVGPLDRFGTLVHAETYRPLLYHHRAVRAPARVVGDRATQRVVVTSAAGARVVYTFTLSRQTDGAYAGCWMTDGVMREPPSAIAAPRYAVGPNSGRRAG